MTYKPCSPEAETAFTAWREQPHYGGKQTAFMAGWDARERAATPPKADPALREQIDLTIGAMETAAAMFPQQGSAAGMIRDWAALLRRVSALLADRGLIAREGRE